MAGQFKLRISNEKEVTAEDIILEAEDIWRKVKKANVNITDFDRIDELMADMRAAHREFAQSYPIVLRYICQMREYDSKALRRWLRKIERNPWKTEEEYLDAQADYVSILYRVKHPRMPVSNAHAIRSNIKAMLVSEHKTFKQYADTFHRQVEEEEKAWVAKNNAELREFLEVVGDGISQAGTIRCEVDADLAAPAASKRPREELHSAVREVREVAVDDLLG